MKHKTAILLLNLGTPDSPKKSDVRKYLTQFLNDPRVIDIPWLLRKILVNGIIVPTYATTCNDDDATPMKPCRDWCLEIYRTCTNSPTNTEGMSLVMCAGDDLATTKCYGNDGVKGMKPGSATGSAAIPRPYPPSVVLPLAVAVVGLGTVLSGNAPA